MTEYDKLTRGAEFVHCKVCDKKARRVGTKDYCDVYVCEDSHGFRIPVGAVRKVWDELGSRSSQSTQ